MAEKTFNAALDQLDDVLGFVDGQLDEIACPMKSRMQVQIAVEEIFVNIASYAYAPETGEMQIDYQLSDDSKTFTVVIADKGKEFNPLEREDPDINAPLEEREIGGLGLFLVKKTMDEVKYERIDNKNVLMLKKRF